MRKKIPFFCEVCGFMGHDFGERGNGVWQEKDKQCGRGMLIAKRREVSYAPTSRARALGRGPRGGHNIRRGRSGRANTMPVSVILKMSI